MLQILISLLAFHLPAKAQNAPSISDLPLLSRKLLHHYDCDVRLFVREPMKNLVEKLMIPAIGSGSHAMSATKTLHYEGNSVYFAGNTQLLSIEWKRGDRKVALATVMIKDSPARAFVLLVNDPELEKNQASFTCSAVTYADLKEQIP